jgi:hypothetical protein
VKDLLALLLGGLVLAGSASAQTVSPVIQEYQQKADSRFQIYNDADVPMTVTLEPFSFSVDAAGNATFRKLDPGINVQLSATSFRVQPRQTFHIFYRASAETLPAWFCIYATVTGPTTASGIKLAFKLPHTVYLLDRAPLSRDEVIWTRAESTVENNKRRVQAVVENVGSRFARVRQVDVTAAVGKQTFAGFPLFPKQKRVIDVEWQGPGTPQTIALTFDRFKTEANLDTVTALSQPEP